MIKYPKIKSLYTNQEPRSFLKGVIKLDNLNPFSSLLGKDFESNSLGRIYFLACLNSNLEDFRDQPLQVLLDKYYPNMDLDTISDNLASAILRFLKDKEE